MEEKRPPPRGLSDINTGSPLPRPSADPGLNSDIPFTPRNTIPPEGLDSESEDGVFTPLSSPPGPRYDDLPPSYDEAQQQALQDARHRIPSLDLDNISLRHLALRDDQFVSPNASQSTNPELPLYVETHELEAATTRNTRSLGMTVPVQYVSTNEQIPVGQSRPENRVRSQIRTADNTVALLEQALQFTLHEPDADIRYAPRLTRRVAIPQKTVSPTVEGRERCGGRRHRHGRGRNNDGRERGRGPPWGRAAREARRMPGHWPEAESNETPSTESNGNGESVQFMRGYAKSLHPHSIRPAEFVEFIEGLNSVCFATNTTPRDLVDTPSPLVRNYIDSTNEVFFAPRGLKVSLQSLATLVDKLNIPEERGQRAGAVATAQDHTTTPAQRAAALHPWIEKLENDVPEPSNSSLMTKLMSENLRRNSTSTETPRDNSSSDPPHSIPEPPPGPGSHGFPPFPQFPPFPPFGGHHGRGHIPWPPSAPWTPHQVPSGRGNHYPPGRRPFPWGLPPHHTHHHGRGGYGWGAGGPGVHPRGFGTPGSVPPLPFNNLGALGETLGKWGEDFGKRTEEWGNGFGRRAETWSEGLAASAPGMGVAGMREERRAADDTRDPVEALDPATSTLETGVVHDGGKPEMAVPREDADSRHGHDVKDASSVHSSSSSDSDSDSDSEDEYPDTHALFLERVREINKAAELSRQKGKKSPEAIAHERDISIEKAQAQCTALDQKIEERRTKRTVKKDLKLQKREIEKKIKNIKKEAKGLGDEFKKELKGSRKEFKKEAKGLATQYKSQQKEAREQWKQEHRGRKEEGRSKRRSRRSERRGFNDSDPPDRTDGEDREKTMFWIVVENIGE